MIGELVPQKARVETIAGKSSTPCAPREGSEMLFAQKP